MIDWPVILWRLAGYGVAVGMVGGAVAWWNHHEREIGRADGRAEVQAKWDAEKKARAEATTAEQTRQTEAVKEIQRVASISRAHLDAAARVVAAGGLRNDAAGFATGGCEASAHADGRTPAVDRAAVLADLLGEVDEYAGRLATSLDDARLAGHVCEAYAESLQGGVAFGRRLTQQAPEGGRGDR